VGRATPLRLEPCWRRLRQPARESRRDQHAGAEQCTNAGRRARAPAGGPAPPRPLRRQGPPNRRRRPSGLKGPLPTWWGTGRPLSLRGSGRQGCWEFRIFPSGTNSLVRILPAMQGADGKTVALLLTLKVGRGMLANYLPVLICMPAGRCWGGVNGLGGHLRSRGGPLIETIAQNVSA